MGSNCCGHITPGVHEDRGFGGACQSEEPLRCLGQLGSPNASTSSVQRHRGTSGRNGCSPYAQLGMGEQGCVSEGMDPRQRSHSSR